MQLQLCIALPKPLLCIALPKLLLLKIVPDDIKMSKKSALTARSYNPLYVVHLPKPALFISRLVV